LAKVLLQKFRPRRVSVKYALVASIATLLGMGTAAPFGIAQLIVPDPLPRHLQLKTSKEHLLSAKSTPRGDVLYSYQSNRAVSPTPSEATLAATQKRGL
jgi:hypothetical protein